MAEAYPSSPKTKMERGIAMFLEKADLSPKHLARFLLVASSITISSCAYAVDEASYGPEEKRWVDKAVQVYTAGDDEAKGELLSHTTPVVIFLPDLVCVGFKLRSNSIGGEFSVCFDRENGAVEYTHTEGE